jgi:DNA-binding PadR family transcriptional regulator
MSIALELRRKYPDWAKITPAKRLILQHLVDNGGEVQFWPGHIYRSTGPMRRLELVGYVESWQRAEDRYAKYRITEDGRKALAAA